MKFDKKNSRSRARWFKWIVRKDRGISCSSSFPLFSAKDIKTLTGHEYCFRYPQRVCSQNNCILPPYKISPSVSNDNLQSDVSSNRTPSNNGKQQWLKYNLVSYSTVLLVADFRLTLITKIDCIDEKWCFVFALTIEFPNPTVINPRTATNTPLPYVPLKFKILLYLSISLSMGSYAI